MRCYEAATVHIPHALDLLSLSRVQSLQDLIINVALSLAHVLQLVLIATGHVPWRSPHDLEEAPYSHE